MKNLESVVHELEEIINNKLSNFVIPIQRGNTIRIGNIVIRSSKQHGYVVFDTKTNKPITNTFSKTGAVAVAQAVLKNKPIGLLKKYDCIIEKNYNDTQFYYHIINGTSNQVRKQAIQSRLEISQAQMDRAKEVLDEFILKDIR